MQPSQGLPAQRFGVQSSRYPSTPAAPGFNRPGYAGGPMSGVMMSGGARMPMGPPGAGPIQPHAPPGTPAGVTLPHAYSGNIPPPIVTSQQQPQTGRASTSAGASCSKTKDKEPKGKGSASSAAAQADKDKDEESGVMHTTMERKRPAATPDPRLSSAQQLKSKKKKKVADKILPQRVRDLVPESQAYMDLLSFERKLDSTIMRKRLDIQEALKRPMKQKKKLRIFISNTFYPAKHDGVCEESSGGQDESIASWELRVEGRLMEDSKAPPTAAAPPPAGVDPNKMKRKFSSFFKSLVIELDRELYGPDNHLVEWHRTASTQETDGFQVKRPGDHNVKCTLLLMLDYQPMQFKLDLRLARLLGIHTQTRPVIVNALWQYIKTHKLQDTHEREYINCDKYLEQILECSRMKFSEIPSRLHPLLMPPDPIVINHVITVDGPDAKKTACYDIDVEVDDTLKQQMNTFLLSTQSQQEIQGLDNKIHETVETINQLKSNRDFFLGFAKNPQEFINNWLISQTRDLKTMTDSAGNPEEERHAEFYYQPWAQEAVSRYFYSKVQQRRVELEQMLGVRS